MCRQSFFTACTQQEESQRNKILWKGTVSIQLMNYPSAAPGQWKHPLDWLGAAFRCHSLWLGSWRDFGCSCQRPAASANPVLQKFVWRPLIPCMQKPRQRASSEEMGDRAGSCKAFVELWHHYDCILFLSLPISLDPLYKYIYIYFCVYRYVYIYI